MSNVLTKFEKKVWKTLVYVNQKLTTTLIKHVFKVPNMLVIFKTVLVLDINDLQ